MKNKSQPGLCQIPTENQNICSVMFPMLNLFFNQVDVHVQPQETVEKTSPVTGNYRHLVWLDWFKKNLYLFLTQTDWTELLTHSIGLSTHLNGTRSASSKEKIAVCMELPPPLSQSWLSDRSHYRGCLSLIKASLIS